MKLEIISAEFAWRRKGVEDGPYYYTLEEIMENRSKRVPVHLTAFADEMLHPRLLIAAAKRGIVPRKDAVNYIVNRNNIISQYSRYGLECCNNATFAVKRLHYRNTKEDTGKLVLVGG